MKALSQNTVLNRALYADFADVLQYPRSGWDSNIRDLIKALDIENPDASNALDEFLQDSHDFTLEKMQECFSRAFDVAPQCIPYLSVYLFGEESYKRSELMTGLLGAYEDAGYTPAAELPDHLAVVLGFATHSEEQEWRELVRWCLPGPLGEMQRGLERAQNPYKHVLRALLLLFKAQYPKEFSHV